MIAKFVQSITSKVSPLEGNLIQSEERVRFGVVDSGEIRGDLEAVEWSDSIIERCRFHSATIADSSFERVVIRDCDLSGVTFRNCLLRDCLILGIKARSYLGLDNCIIDRVTVARSDADRIELHNTNISAMEFIRVGASQLTFHQCKAHKREGRVTFADCGIDRVGGLEAMAKLGVRSHVDELMWRELGDHYLRENGFEKLSASSALSDDAIDDLTSGLDRRRTL